jgi:hypothetical protein
MKNTYFLKLILITLVTPLFSGAQSFQWGRGITSDGYNECLDIATDNAGSVYACGMIEFQSDFGNGLILESTGIHDIFLAKYDSTNALVWAKRAGGREGDKAVSIAVDASKNVYITGEMEDSSEFDGNYFRTQGGANNFYVAKYDAAGNFQWLKSIGCDSLSSRGIAITVSPQGDVYAAGIIESNAYINGVMTYVTAGDNDILLLKYDTNGNLIWSKQIGASGPDKCYGIALDNSGHMYLTGYFCYTVQFDSHSVNGPGGTDIFLAKFDTGGNCLWVEQAGDTSLDKGRDVTVNVNGDIVITGEFSVNAQFGSNSVYTTGNIDMFIAAYDDSGNNLWVKRGGSVEDDAGRAISHDAAGNLFVAGDYADAGTWGSRTASSNGFADVFLVCYNSVGHAEWVKSAGGPLNDRGRGTAADVAGKVYFGGDYNETITFDNITLPTDTNTNIFITRLSQSTIINCNMSATASTTSDVSCNGLCDGIADVNASGAGNISYSWNTSPVQNSQQATGLCAGTYMVTATDAQGCTITANATITEPSAIVVTAVITNASCIGCTDGRVNVSVTGGNSPYDYTWSNGPTSQDLNNVGAGTYILCVEDDNNCMQCDSFTVFQPGVSVPTVDNEKFISVFPNPANDFCVVKTLITLDEKRLVIRNSTGELILESEFAGDEFRFDTHRLSAGIYFYDISGNLNNKEIFIKGRFTVFHR